MKLPGMHAMEVHTAYLRQIDHLVKFGIITPAEAEAVKLQKINEFRAVHDMPPLENGPAHDKVREE